MYVNSFLIFHTVKDISYEFEKCIEVITEGGNLFVSDVAVSYYDKNGEWENLLDVIAEKGPSLLLHIPPLVQNALSQVPANYFIIIIIIMSCMFGFTFYLAHRYVHRNPL